MAGLVEGRYNADRPASVAHRSLNRFVAARPLAKITLILVAANTGANRLGTGSLMLASDAPVIVHACKTSQHAM